MCTYNNADNESASYILQLNQQKIIYSDKNNINNMVP